MDSTLTVLYCTIIEPFCASMVKLQVVDAAFPSESASIDVDCDTTLAECRALVLTLALPSSEQFFLPNREIVLCHDGRVLSSDDEETTTLAELRVLDAPILVVLSKKVDGVPASTRAELSDPPTVVDSVSASPPAQRNASVVLPPPEDALCRICFGAAFENGAGKLISPCLCSGSSGYVHVSCLNDWRSTSANPRSFFECDQCHYRYNLQRTEWAAWLESERVVRAAATLMLLTCTLAAAGVLGPIGIAPRFYRLVAFDPSAARDSGTLIASHWSWWLDYFVAGTLGVAAAGFIISIRDAYEANRHMQAGLAHSSAIRMYRSCEHSSQAADMRTLGFAALLDVWAADCTLHKR